MVTLDHRTVYILPSNYGVFFAGALLLILLGSINYSLSLGYVLVFLLASMAIVSILHTWRNLAGLRVAAGKSPPVFAGETVHLGLRLSSSALERYCIGFLMPGFATQFADIPDNGHVDVVLELPAEQRGYFRPGRLTFFTRYPLGLFRAWGYVKLDTQCLIYPRPEAGQVPLPQVAEHGDSQGPALAGADDYGGLRSYQPGDSMRHIAWKASARGESLLTKQFESHLAPDIVLDWALLPSTLDVEAKLSRLTRWVIDCQQRGYRYALRLPGTDLPPDEGEEHYRRCLQTLALFGLEAS